MVELIGGLDAAVEDIDDKFGKGYAHDHPELVAAYIQSVAIQEAGQLLANTLGGDKVFTVSEALTHLGEAVSSCNRSIDEVAHAIAGRHQ